jgi:hypothetical protein
MPLTPEMINVGVSVAILALGLRKDLLKDLFLDAAKIDL